MPPLTTAEREEFFNMFLTQTPAQIGISKEQFCHFGKLLSTCSPEHVLRILQDAVENNRRRIVVAEQKAYEASMGYDFTTTSPCKEDMKRKVSLMYEDDEPHNKRGILCAKGRNKPRGAKPKRSGIRFKSGEPEMCHYVPDAQIREPGIPGPKRPLVNKPSRLESTSRARSPPPARRRCSPPPPPRVVKQTPERRAQPSPSGSNIQCAPCRNINRPGTSRSSTVQVVKHTAGDTTVKVVKR